MRNLIFNAYAYFEDYASSVNLKSNDKINIYLKNAFVSLKSALLSNPNCDVALITNIHLPQSISKLYIQNKIRVYECPFDNFKFKKDYPWSLAFYKLCALKFANNLDYDNILIIDTDTYVQKSLDDLFEECKYKLMLYDINHRLETPNYNKFILEYRKFSGLNNYPVNYGGEFIAGNHKNVSLFINECTKVYNKLIEKNFITSFGDEFIIANAADKLSFIKNAGGYIYRYWNSYSFYLVSTNYKYNPVSILHFPNEKNYGMLYLYNYFIKKNRFPRIKKIYKKFNIYVSDKKLLVSSLYRKFLKK